MKPLSLLYLIAILECSGLGMPKRQETHLAPAGMYTDPHYSKAPPGALLVAKNVVCRRDGIIEPRVGIYGLTTSSSGLTDYQRVIPYDADLLCIDVDGLKTEWYSNRGTDIVDENSADLEYIDKENVHWVESRDNLYFTTIDGVQKFTSGGDSASNYAGAPYPGTIAGTYDAAGSLLANNESVRYRAIVKTIDANGMTLKSIPTAPLVVVNTAGAARDVALTYYISNEEAVDDIVQIYRSTIFAASTDPDDELYLVHEHEITSAIIAAGGFNVTDDVADASLGEALYTNPSREGLEQSNYKPPYAKDVLLFKKSVFYLNTINRHRLIVTMDQAITAHTGQATGASWREIDPAGVTNGSNVLTNGNATGAEIGQYIYDSLGYVPANTYIIGLSGSDATMSQNATGTSAADVVYLIDTITIGTPGTYETYIGGTPPHIASRFARQITNESSDYYAESGQSYSGFFGTITDTDTLMVEKRLPNQSAFYIWATHGEAYFPALSGPTESGGSLVFSTSDGYQSDNNARPNGVTYSKSDEPEHIPLGNYDIAGSSKYGIKRGAVYRDTLYLFKEDGIWTLNGYGALSGWRIDEFDRTHILIRPDALAVLNDGIYAWTNMGVVRINESGITPISKLSINKSIESVQWDLINDSSETLGVYATADLRNNEFLLTVPPGAGDDEFDFIYIFNTKTGAWTYWDYSSDSYYQVFINPNDNKLYIAGAGPALLVERISASTKYYYDEGVSKTISNITGNRLTFSAAHGAAVGDLIYQVGDYGIVTAIVSSTVLDIDDSTGFTASSATVCESYQCVIQWVAKVGDNPMLRKHFYRGALTFDSVAGIYNIDIAFKSDMSNSYSTIYESWSKTTSVIPRSVKFRVPNAHSRAVQLYPTVTIQQATFYNSFQLTGLSLEYEELKQRATQAGGY